MTKRKAFAAMLGILMAVPPGLPGAWAASVAAQIKGIRLAPDELQISLSKLPSYKSFVLEKPPRLVIDLMGTSLGGAPKSLPGAGRWVSDVRSGEIGKGGSLISRVVLDLKALTRYKVFEREGLLLVRLEGVSAPKFAPAGDPPAKGPKDPPSDPPAKVAQAMPIPAMGASYTAVPAAVASGQSAAAEPAAAPRPAKAAPAASTGMAAKVSTDIMGRLPHDKVSLDFEGTDIRDVLKLFAAKAKINIIAGSDVEGSVTLHLADVPFNEAFQTVLSVMNLTTSQVGNDILRVMTPAEYQRAQASAPTVTTIIPLNYTKAEDMTTEVNTVRQSEGRKGKSIPDLKTNSLIVTDTLDGVIETQRLVSQLDVQPRQVLIEAKVVEVTLSKNFNYGVQWQYLGVNQNASLTHGGTNMIGTANPSSALSQLPAGAATTVLNSGQSTSVSAPYPNTSIGSNLGGTGVNLPVPNPYGALALGRVTNSYFLNAALSASAAQGRLKVLSDPKVATLNNQTANINVTTNIPYVTTNLAGTGLSQQRVTYILTGIRLQVTPTINAQGRVTLLIVPTVSQPSTTISANVQTGAPAIDSRDAKTTIIVKDGETIVIGGLIKDSLDTVINKVPFLGDIPVIGWLFKSKSLVRSRTELLIFVTPKILED